MTFSGSKAQAMFKKSLEKYAQSQPLENQQHREVLERGLSIETKAMLRSGTTVFDQKTMQDINSELLEEVYYPSPHSFRHIWAEAVLTRYQGDVGAVILHQFCHLDNSFFMAYLREKDTRGMMKVARQRYLNSLVEMLIIESDSIGRKYIGGFAHFVKKATDLTHVVTDSELIALKESINGRVIHVQSNPFSDCLPRDGAEKRAKCAQMGMINPQDAKLVFCLHCANALITKGNIRGIWQTVQPMVKEALNEHAPGELIADHLPTLQSAKKRIKELRGNVSNQYNVDKVLSLIDSAINSIENKLIGGEA